MPKDRKSKDTGKIRFFKINPSGDIASAYPEQSTEAGRQREKTGPSSVAPLPPLEGATSISELPPLQLDLEELRNQVEGISVEETADTLSSDQFSILKKYLSLKEAEARDLKEQKERYKEYLNKLTQQLEQLNSQYRETLDELDLAKEREEALRHECQKLKERNEEVIVFREPEVQSQLEPHFEALLKKKEEWRAQVKADLKRLKLKERELENKYELLKRDSQALLDSKDKHILELKQKCDQLELDVESLEERLRQSDRVLAGIASKKKRLIETMKLAIALLSDIDQLGGKEEERKRTG